MSTRFALVGVRAAVADRHVRAIDDLDGVLVATADPAGEADVVRKRFPEATHYDTPEALAAAAKDIDKFVVCTPNDMHESHVELGLRMGADVICEKPVALEPSGVDRLAALEEETGRRVHTVLQIREHPEIQRMAAEARGDLHQVELDYVLARGPEFLQSWHGREDRSGGLIFEIGIHFLDFLGAIFGAPQDVKVAERIPQRVRGTMRLERAEVKWRLSIDPMDVPAEKRDEPHPSHRVLTVDGRDYDLARGRGTRGLHEKLYQDILAGGGYGLDDARRAIALADGIRQATPDLSEVIR